MFRPAAEVAGRSINHEEDETLDCLYVSLSVGLVFLSDSAQICLFRGFVWVYVLFASSPSFERACCAVSVSFCVRMCFAQACAALLLLCWNRTMLLKPRTRMGLCHFLPCVYLPVHTARNERVHLHLTLTGAVPKTSTGHEDTNEGGMPVCSIVKS